MSNKQCVLKYHVLIFLYAGRSCRINDLQKTKVNVTKIRKVRVDGNKFHTGKNGGHRPSNLGSRSIVVVSE